MFQGKKSISEFLSEVRRAAEYCDFGQFYPQAVRDRFICGLSDESTRKALLS